jgi:hypothetical protein
MPDMENFQALIGVLNAALEHVPEHTRLLLANAAKPHADALAEKLKPTDVQPA